MSLMEAFVTVAQRAGEPVWIPDDVEGTCCGVPFSSKGYDQAHAVAVNRAIERFWEWSDEGRLADRDRHESLYLWADHLPPPSHGGQPRTFRSAHDP